MYEFIVSEDQAGIKLNSILGTQHGMSRRLLRRVIARHPILCNGVPVLLNYVVKSGDRISIELPQEVTTVAPEKMNLEVCYEDSLVLVVNKPAGILTHPTSRDRTGSLLAGVAGYLEHEQLVPHSVHRLDKYTSGAILFAKHAHAHHLLDVALRNQWVHRSYVALVYSNTPIALNTWFTIKDFIAQDPNKPSRRVIGNDENGQVAITHYQALERIGSVYLCRFRLETGRTHQIRLQMASRGMPLVGDRDYTYTYFSSESVPREAKYYERILPYQALHAYALSWRTKLDVNPYHAFAKPSAMLEELWTLLGAKSSILDVLCNLPS